MSDELTIEYRRLDEVTALRWGRNPKLHDLGALADSIRRHGMIDPPGWDRNLNGGYGGLLYGNGRDEALEWMHAQGEAPPRGVKVDSDGMWLIPVKVGVDQTSEAEAEAAAIAHNNLVLSGGNFTAFDMSKLWGDGYTDVLASLATSDALPITVDGDALDGLLNRQGDGILNADDLWKGMPEFEQEDLESWKSIKVHFANEEDYHNFARLTGQTLTPHTKSIWHPYRAKEDLTQYRVEDES